MRLIRYLKDLLTWLEDQRVEPEQPGIRTNEAGGIRQQKKEGLMAG
jgi:hypothetical protein